MRLPLREQCLRGLAGTISPMLVLHHHGCERQCAELADAVRAHLGRSADGSSSSSSSGGSSSGGGGGGGGEEEEQKRARPAQQCHVLAELEGPLSAQAGELRDCLLGVCHRVLDAVLHEEVREEGVAVAAADGGGGGSGGGGGESESAGEGTGDSAGANAGGGARAALGQAGFELAAQLKLREYPAAASMAGGAVGAGAGAGAGVRLGGHVDNTLLTLLWADAPGLQVLSPRDPRGWTGEAVAALGLPSWGGAPAPPLDDELDWGEVAAPGGAPWGAGPLLLTVGAEWLGLRGAPLAHVESAVLHRVAVPHDLGRDRFSLPFLVRLAPLTTQQQQQQQQQHA